MNCVVTLYLLPRNSSGGMPTYLDMSNSRTESCEFVNLTSHISSHWPHLYFTDCCIACWRAKETYCNLSPLRNTHFRFGNSNQCKIGIRFAMFMRQFKTDPIIEGQHSRKCRQNKLLCVFKCSINLEFAIAVLSVLLSDNGLALKIFYNSICIRMPMTPLSARLIMQRPRKRWFREDLTLYWEVLLGFNLGIICDKFLIMALNRMWVRPFELRKSDEDYAAPSRECSYIRH